MKLLIPFLMAMLTGHLLAQEFTSIHSGNDGENYHPFYGLYDYSHNMYIYDQVDIGNGEKEIFELSFDLSSYGDGYTYYDLTIKLAHTSDDEFRSNARVNLSNIEHRTLTTCITEYDLQVNTDGFITIPFTTSFNYNGVDNLLVIVENHDGDWTMGFGAGKGMYTPNYKSWYKYSDNYYPSGTGTRQRFIPNLGLGYFSFNPLPIELLSFSGYANNNNDVELEWGTVSEQNNAHFTIWRSFNGTEWTAIHQVVGAGNSNEYLEYNYTDLGIKNHNGLKTIYYKLSQTDYDGKSEVFDPISIELNTLSRKLIKTVNFQGETVEKEAKGFVIEVWSDGNNVKKMRQ